MLAMTQEAADAVETIVSRPEVPDSAVIRIAAGEGLDLELVSAPQASDLVVADVRIAVEAGSLAYLDDKLLDAEVDGSTVEFKLYDQPR
jgi:Fe-S cluster assembly iron-binding protein IscA